MALNRSLSIRKERRLTSGRFFYYLYFFSCSECGAEISSQHSYLKKHSGLCISCSHRGRPFGPAYNSLLNNRHADKMTVELTYEEFAAICEISKCHYCGETINRHTRRGVKGYKGYFLDRMDNDKPYTKENCVPCCWPCNQTKGNRFTYAQFVAIGAVIKSFRRNK